MDEKEVYGSGGASIGGYQMVGNGKADGNIERCMVRLNRQ